MSGEQPFTPPEEAVGEGKEKMTRERWLQTIHQLRETLSRDEFNPFTEEEWENWLRVGEGISFDEETGKAEIISSTDKSEG